jgi:hypothetical protein
VDVPVNLTVAPEPPVPVIVPLSVNVFTADVKFAVLLAPLTVTLWLGGVKTKPLFVGVTV